MHFVLLLELGNPARQEDRDHGPGLASFGPGRSAKPWPRPRPARKSIIVNRLRQSLQRIPEVPLPGARPRVVVDADRAITVSRENPVQPEPREPTMMPGAPASRPIPSDRLDRRGGLGSRHNFRRIQFELAPIVAGHQDRDGNEDKRRADPGDEAERAEAETA